MIDKTLGSLRDPFKDPLKDPLKGPLRGRLLGFRVGGGSFKGSLGRRSPSICTLLLGGSWDLVSKVISRL